MSERPPTLADLVTRKREGRKLVMLTCYDALFARLLEGADVDMMLVGDSLNQLLAGRASTLSATLDQMIYHAASVRRGATHTPVVVDLPFLSYQVNIEEAVRHAGRVLAETDCHAVKLEGGMSMAPTIRALVDRGIPVIGHLGFTPQSCQPARPQGSKVATTRRQLAFAPTRPRSKRRVRPQSCSSLCPPRSRPRSPRASIFRRLASEQAKAVTARCWYCTTCWDSTRDSRRAFSGDTATLRGR